jgi:hypothetical protein
VPCPHPLPMSTDERTLTSEVVWQHVGRVYLNPSTGKAVWVGYLVHINEFSSSLFNGSPSVATAYFLTSRSARMY